MANESWQEILERFIRLGGEFVNLEIRSGQRGRGVFILDPSRQSRLLCPRNLLVPRELLVVQEGRLKVRSDPCLSEEARALAEDYYQRFSYGLSGEFEAGNFLKEMTLFSEAAKTLLKKHNIVTIQPNTAPSPAQALARFINTRAVDYFGRSMMAPIWELVNHDAYSRGFSVTERGIAAGVPIAGEAELTHRYNSCRSPLGQWVNYGFASQELFCFAFPFKLHLKDSGAVIQCRGRHGTRLEVSRQYANDKIPVVIVESLPIGCRSTHLPEACLQKILIKAGSGRSAARFLSHLQEINIHKRVQILESVQEQQTYAAQSLRKALQDEIRLIECSRV